MKKQILILLIALSSAQPALSFFPVIPMFIASIFALQTKKAAVNTYKENSTLEVKFGGDKLQNCLITDGQGLEAKRQNYIEPHIRECITNAIHKKTGRNENYNQNWRINREILSQYTGTYVEQRKFPIFYKLVYQTMYPRSEPKFKTKEYIFDINDTNDDKICKI
jgi:hypothetical protein